MECPLCPVLQKKLEDKDLRIQELEAELKSQKHKNEELSMELEEAKSKITSIATNPDSMCQMFRAILNKKSKAEIEHLVDFGEVWKMPNDDGDSVLHVAARAGDPDVVKYFISIGAEVDARNTNGNTPLMEAAKSNENFREVVELLIRNGADLRATNKAGENALMFAVEAGKNAEDSKMLSFENCMRTTCHKSKNRDTVLHKASASGNLEAWKYFITQKPRINVFNRLQCTPLMSAAYAKENFMPIVDLLLKNGADIKIRDLYQRNVLYHAIISGRPVEDMKKLVEAGAHWNNEGILPFCIKNGHAEAVKYFIEEGAYLYGRPDLGMGTLLAAAKYEMTEFIDILIDREAKHPTRAQLLKRQFQVEHEKIPPPVKTLEKLCDAGVTWDYSVVLNGYAKEGNKDGILFCLRKGVDINANNLDRSPIYCALTGPNPKLEVVELFIQMGANINLVSSFGTTILHDIAGNSSPIGQHLAIIKKLVICGAISGAIGSLGSSWNPILHAAVRGGRPEVVQYFISKGADVNGKDSFCHDTPFLRAVRCTPSVNLPEVLRVLVNGGADPNAWDRDGNSAILLGLNRGKTTCEQVTLDQIKMLVALGCDWRVPNKEGVTVISWLQGKHGINDYLILDYFIKLGVENFEME